MIMMTYNHKISKNMRAIKYFLIKEAYDINIYFLLNNYFIFKFQLFQRNLKIDYLCVKIIQMFIIINKIIFASENGIKQSSQKQTQSQEIGFKSQTSLEG